MFNKHLEAQNCTWNKDFHHFLKFPSLVFLDFLEIGTEMIFTIETLLSVQSNVLAL